MNRALIALAMLATLAACGSRTSLYPEPGIAVVPKAAAADRGQTAEELMRPSTQAQPDRQADLLTKSKERGDDPFDLPMGKNNGDPATSPAAASRLPIPPNIAPDANVAAAGLPAEPTKRDDGAPDANTPDNGVSPDNKAQ
jgi:predicted small lipoprotein YifL